MYVVLYSFQVKPQQEESFLKGWKGLTALIYKHEGSLGSRLHKEDTLEYIAYAQWPSKDQFDNSGGNLPKEQADKFRGLMRKSCSKIEILHKFEVVEDLLADKIYD
ncbi:antibiotic biosynthesis monooxygenase family protein [Algibacter mikhailovii]|uniref:antibiotic biosynthesis monooxygenase family protein n=1 Tax=Algibacter mikhailovii TaxID=425498 RepID=UPI0024947F5B|nr:antibiotic biosynthesis monooxygenase [Algibacter mikhailovii]